MLAVSIGFVLVYNSARIRTKLHRAGIVSPESSPWNFLFKNGDEASFINMTGFSRATFMLLRDIVMVDALEGEIRLGRSPLLDSIGKLGLFLLLATSRMDKQVSGECEHYKAHFRD